MSLRDLQTPAALVDEAVARRNCERMLARARDWDVELRPHVKTHKTVEGARLQLGARSGPITVSTLAEAELFAEAGFEDITWAVPLAPAKIERALAVAGRIRKLTFLVDHRVAVEELGKRAPGPVDVMIKIDSGYHRAGLDPGSEELRELALLIVRAGKLRLTGLLTHAGHSYHARSVEEIRSIAEDEVAAVREARNIVEPLFARDRLTLSVGSTPTASVGDLSGADEIRPGNYIFFDAFQAALGACSIDDCAFSVLTSVIGSYPDREKLIVDAGAIALSKDRGTGTAGYGILKDMNGRTLELSLDALSQEHGEVSGPAALVGDFVPGDRLRVIVNHSCLTAANFDIYWTMNDNEVTGSWRPAKGW